MSINIFKKAIYLLKIKNIFNFQYVIIIKKLHIGWREHFVRVYYEENVHCFLHNRHESIKFRFW